MVIESIINSLVKSWRTTVIGVIGGLMICLPELRALLDGADVNLNTLASGLLIMFGFGMARDNSVTSEKAAARV